MRSNIDRVAGVRLITDPPYPVRTDLRVPPTTDIAHLDFEAPADDRRIVALKGRVTAGLGVQLLADLDSGQTFITLALDGETETFPVPPEKALDAFDHPFVYGGTLL